jgi:hypothetical protein
MNELNPKLKPYSKAIAKLLKGVVNKKDSVWKDVLFYQDDINDYINKIGLELIVREEDGFAFIKQFEIDDDGNTIGLVSRRQVGFETSVVLVILRQVIEDFENNPIEFLGTEKYISKAELKEEIEMFLPEKYNKVQFLDDLDNYIKKIEDLGYLKEVQNTDEEIKYHVHKIIKEKVTIDILVEFKDKLQAYVESV